MCRHHFFAAMESSHQQHPRSYPPLRHPASQSTKTQETYQQLYDQSIQSPEIFWDEMSKKYLHWFQPYQSIMSGSFTRGDYNWFTGGKLNVSYNCIDRHLPSKGNQTAIIWESDEPGEGRSISYQELFQNVCQIANYMKSMGISKGDVVTLYMPMIPELPMVMLACTRIGAIHSVVFAGFSSTSLQDRINDCNSRWVFTADQGKRGGKIIPLKETIDAALVNCSSVQNVFVFRRTGAEVSMNSNRDIYIEDFLKSQPLDCPPESMDSEDTLFVLYTSGSTGKPKGLAHSTAGYLLHATMTTEWSFDIQNEDIFSCVADCGWITGHTYTVYGPLSLGTTTVIFESIPTYPNPYRYWDLIQRHKITQFYTAPTAIRSLMRYDTGPISQYDLSTLRVLGSVGEPINPEAWHWYYHHIGKEKCTVTDTYWQTETGGHLAANIPGVTPMKPGSCTLPYFGIQFALVNPQTGLEIEGNGVEGVLCIKKEFPSIARTVYGDHERYLTIYTKPYPNHYFTGDGCRRDEDGFYFITGRVDDVVNPSGHRLGTAEIEAAIDEMDEISESAVVGFPHDIKGEGICCFIILKVGIEESIPLAQAIKNAVRKSIGAFATPDIVVFTDLPKTRSGKIMRRILRKVAHGEEDSIGDISTLSDPSVVGVLVEKYKIARSHLT
jgi:acetyl-CoA synthetase